GATERAGRFRRPVPGLILVDTSTWIDADHSPDSAMATELRNLLVHQQVASTDIVIAELLQGAGTEEEFTRVRSRLDALPFFHATPQTWRDAARISYMLRRRGLSTPLLDLAI